MLDLVEFGRVSLWSSNYYHFTPICKKLNSTLVTDSCLIQPLPILGDRDAYTVSLWLS